VIARVGAQRDVHRRDGRRAPPGRLRTTRWSLIDATSGAGGLPVDVSQTDAYYFAPQKSFGADGGLWLALLSPAAPSSGSSELARAPTAGSPTSLSLSTRSRTRAKDQTYNTPALATLLLLADQIDWMLAGGGLDFCVGGRTARVVRSPLRLGRGVGVRDAVRHRPGQALAGRRHDRLRRVGRRSALAKTLRANGIVDVEPYRKLGRNQLRIGMFPAIEPDDVQALTACIDWVVADRSMSERAKVLSRRRSATRAWSCCASRVRRRDRRRLGPTSSSPSRIGEFDGILIRSSHQADADLIGQGRRLRVIGRAGVGVDNVDVDAATRRGIVVANAPQSNVITAAEHTMALLLALARNVPQAHASLIGRAAWDRSKFSGVELHDKTLGIIGFGRIGQLVAQRARGFGMRVIAFDPYVAAERYRDLGVEKADSPDDVYARRRLHHPPPAQDARDRGLAGRRGVREDEGRRADPQRRPRPADRRRGAARPRWTRARSPARRSTCSRASRSPTTRCSAYPNVVVTPHLGASTAEATDRAGYQSAEQVVPR
jgi:phosphoglycerate dehydrogenase-like enzyme